MSFLQEQEQVQAKLNALINKCWEDDSFKQRLIANPIKTMEQFYGKSFEKGRTQKVVVNDQTDTAYMHINIPPKPNLDNLELSDVELEAVAGGAAASYSWFCSWFCTVNPPSKS